VSCLFCRIAAGEAEALRVAGDEHCVAFLDHRPLFPGHVLLVPRLHVATLTDLPDPLLAPLMRWTRALARAVEEALPAEGAFVALNHKVSQSVPHLHVHVVPRRRGDGLKGFFWPRHPYRDAAHAEEVRAAIAARLNST
jgi:histidine triad (HIT) family protein